MKLKYHFFNYRVFIVIALNALFISAFSQSNMQVKQGSSLNVSFVNPLWNGKEVPMIGICKLCGGEGKSPELKISNIPDSANIIVIEFNDRDYNPLSQNGGHGAISVSSLKKTEVIVPSIPEQTFDIPKEVSVEHAHRAPKGNQGAYLGPCSCGYGNRYFAVAKAVFRLQGKADKVLSQATIELGTH